MPLGSPPAGPRPAPIARDPIAAIPLSERLVPCENASMADQGLAVHHTSIWRWVQAYGPEVHRRLHGEVKRKSSTWHMDETFVRIAGAWMYLFRAVDGRGQTVDFYLSETRDGEAAKLFLQRALANPENQPPQVFARDGLRSYPAAILSSKLMAA